MSTENQVEQSSCSPNTELILIQQRLSFLASARVHSFLSLCMLFLNSHEGVLYFFQFCPGYNLLDSNHFAHRYKTSTCPELSRLLVPSKSSFGLNKIRFFEQMTNLNFFVPREDMAVHSAQPISNRIPATFNTVQSAAPLRRVVSIWQSSSWRSQADTTVQQSTTPTVR